MNNFYKKGILTKSRYSACIALDVIGSEQKDNQNDTLSFLTGMINKLNDLFKKNIVFPFHIRGGDEVIGVLNSFAEGYRAFHEIWLLAIEHKFKVRVGLGFGKYDTPDVTDIHQINGSSVISAFRARDKYLKNNENVFYQLSGPVQFYSFSNALDIPYGSINAVIYTMYELVKTEKQRALVWALQTSEPDLTYEEIVKYKLIDRPEWDNQKNDRASISKMVKRMQYKTFRQMKIDVTILLNSIQSLLDSEWEWKKNI